MPGHRAPDRASGVATRRLVAHAEGHDGEQRPQRLVAVVGDRVDPAEGGELAEPEVALLLAGAQHEVGPAELLVEHRARRCGPRRTGPAPPLRRGPARAARGASGRRRRRRRPCRSAPGSRARPCTQPWKRKTSHQRSRSRSPFSPTCPHLDAADLELAAPGGGEHHVVLAGQPPRRSAGPGCPGPAMRGASVSEVTTAMRRRAPGPLGSAPRLQHLGHRAGGRVSHAAQRGRSDAWARGAAPRRRAAGRALEHADDGRRRSPRAAASAASCQALVDEARVVEHARPGPGRRVAVGIVGRTAAGHARSGAGPSAAHPVAGQPHPPAEVEGLEVARTAGSKPPTAWKALCRTMQAPPGDEQLETPSGRLPARRPARRARSTGRRGGGDPVGDEPLRPRRAGAARSTR